MSLRRLERQLCAAVRANLTGSRVPIPEAGVGLWQVFCALSWTRRYHASGPEAISYAEIEAFCRVMRLPLEPRHVAIIVALDREWLSVIQARAAAMAQGVRTVPHISGTAPRLFGKTREFADWPDWMVEKLSTAPIDVQITAELLLGTGQRPNAAIRMKHSDFGGDWMMVLDEKGKEPFKVYCPTRLRTFIAGLAKQGAFILARYLTQPKGYDVEKKFRAWRATLGVEAAPYSLHGLRKLAIIQLAEAGCSDAEIQAVTNQSAQMVAYYRKKASRLLLSKNAQNRRDQNRNET